MPKEEMYQTMLDLRTHEAGAISNSKIYWFAGFALLFIPVVGFFVTFLVRESPKQRFLCGTCIVQVLILIGAIGVKYYSSDGVQRIEEKWNSLSSLTGINGCVDELTILPV